MASNTTTTSKVLRQRQSTVPQISAMDMQDPELGKLNRVLQLLGGQVSETQTTSTTILQTISQGTTPVTPPTPPPSGTFTISNGDF